MVSELVRVSGVATMAMVQSQPQPLEPAELASPSHVGAQVELYATLDAQWRAIHQAGGAIAALAGSAAPPERDDSFVHRVCAASPARRAALVSGIDDLACVLQMGLTALVAVQDEGGDPIAGAATLRHEFDAGRSSLSALLEPDA